MPPVLLLWSLLSVSGFLVHDVGDGAAGQVEVRVEAQPAASHADAQAAAEPDAQAAAEPDQEADAQEGVPQDRWEVYLLTMDQGEQVWERFGHNALLIRDHLTGEELAWNWGLFDFEDVDFIPRFLRGTMLYGMGPADLEPFVAAYAWADRSVYANRIHLTQEEAAELDAFVRWNFEPQNREYVYHYFLDNCSTRLRDALDGVLGGLLRDEFFEQDTPRSFRWHSRRLVQGTPWIDQGLSFLLGARGDRPRTEWEAMFIPMELLESLESYDRPWEGGGSLPLLGSRVTLFESTREPAPEAPASFSALWLVLGLAGAGALAGAALGVSRGMRGARPALALILVSWGLFSGLLGTLLTTAWFTDHDFIQWNLNLLHANPLGLVLAALVAVAAPGREGFRGTPGRAARWLAFAIAGLSLATALLQATPLLHQGNAEVLAVALPVHLGTAWALARVNRVANGSPAGVARKGQSGSDARAISSA